MAIEHLDWPTFGLQFHPESVLTTCGHKLLDNFLHIAGLRSQVLWGTRELDNCEHRELQPPSSEDWSSVGLLHW
jgi:GMP synthase-like glutamine amidotransferase